MSCPAHIILHFKGGGGIPGTKIMKHCPISTVLRGSGWGGGGLGTMLALSYRFPFHASFTHLVIEEAFVE